MCGKKITVWKRSQISETIPVSNTFRFLYFTRNNDPGIKNFFFSPRNIKSIVCFIIIYSHKLRHRHLGVAEESNHMFYISIIIMQSFKVMLCIIDLIRQFYKTDEKTATTCPFVLPDNRWDLPLYSTVPLKHPTSNAFCANRRKSVAFIKEK